MPTTTGMKGGGYYDAHSKEQRAAIDASLTWMEQAIADLPITTASQTALALLDVGSSEGGNAIYAMNRLIRRLRDLTDAPISVLFSDLPSNDFNHLFANLFPVGAPAIAGANIFSSAIGGTAFGRLVPEASLHVVTTFNAIGFLDSKPNVRLPHYVLPMEPGPLASREGVSVSEREQAPFRRQATDDLCRFYTARAEELVRGGKLLVQVFGRNDRFSTSHGIYDVLSDAILDCVEAGLLPREVYEELIFPIYFRTLEELVQPIETDKQLASAFRVERAESQEVSVPFNNLLVESGDKVAWTRAYTGFLRAFTEAILRSAIPKNLPRADIVEKIYQRVEQLLATDAARYEFHYVSVAALLTRV